MPRRRVAMRGAGKIGYNRGRRKVKIAPLRISRQSLIGADVFIAVSVNRRLYHRGDIITPPLAAWAAMFYSKRSRADFPSSGITTVVKW